MGDRGFGKAQSNVKVALRGEFQVPQGYEGIVNNRLNGYQCTELLRLGVRYVYTRR
jgi:hypothetical protein